MKKTSIIRAAVALILALALALALSTAGYLAFRSAPAPAPDVGYTELNGAKHRLEDLRGQVVLVNFWATDCAPCIKEMPALAATHGKFGARGLQTLAVARSYDAPANVVDFAQARKLPFTVAIDLDGAIARSFAAESVTPTTLLIDRQGRIVVRHVGELDFDELHAHIERLLGTS